MFDAPGTPAYPPPHDTWRFPPPEVPTRWKWIAVAVGVLALVVAVAMVATIVTHVEEDPAGFIDDQGLIKTVRSECELMNRTVDALPLTGGTQRQAATIADQDRAVEVMVRSIRAERAAEIRQDRPAEQWLRDWQRLVDARELYARQLLRNPRASLAVPLDDRGIEITVRMRDVWLGESECEVPSVLSFPYVDLSGV